MTLDEYTAEFNRLSAAAGWIPYRAGQLATFMLDGDTPAEALEMELAYADKEGRDAI